MTYGYDDTPFGNKKQRERQSGKNGRSQRGNDQGRKPGASAEQKKEGHPEFIDTPENLGRREKE